MRRLLKQVLFLIGGWGSRPAPRAARVAPASPPLASPSLRRALPLPAKPSSKKEGIIARVLVYGKVKWWCTVPLAEVEAVWGAHGRHRGVYIPWRVWMPLISLFASSLFTVVPLVQVASPRTVMTTVAIVALVSAIVGRVIGGWLESRGNVITYAVRSEYNPATKTRTAAPFSYEPLDNVLVTPAIYEAIYGEAPAKDVPLPNVPKEWESRALIIPPWTTKQMLEDYTAQDWLNESKAGLSFGQKLQYGSLVVLALASAGILFFGATTFTSN